MTRPVQRIANVAARLLHASPFEFSDDEGVLLPDCGPPSEIGPNRPIVWTVLNKLLRKR